MSWYDISILYHLSSSSSSTTIDFNSTFHSKLRPKTKTNRRSSVGLPCAKLYHGKLCPHGCMPTKPNGERHEGKRNSQAIQVPHMFAMDSWWMCFQSIAYFHKCGHKGNIYIIIYIYCVCVIWCDMYRVHGLSGIASHWRISRNCLTFGIQNLF